jgi:hypothetical protein
MSDVKRYKGQTVIVEGSKTGADVFRTKIAYDTAFNPEFFGDAKYGTKTSAGNWYIEKVIYDAAFNATDFLTATNKLFIKPQQVDIAQNGQQVDITFTNPTDALGCINNKDGIYLITANNNIQGIIVGYDRGTQTITVDNGNAAVTDETNATVNDEDAILTLNDESTKPFDKRVWDLRESYIYE